MTVFQKKQCRIFIIVKIVELMSLLNQFGTEQRPNYFNFQIKIQESIKLFSSLQER